MQLSENILMVQERIRAAAKASGRSENEVKLVAVTKTQPVEVINQAIELGLRVIGENKPQELLEKLPKLLPCEKHMIGHLQSNKAKLVAGNVTLVHSLDRLSLAAALDSAAKSKNIVCDCLIQVNIGEEPQKGGVSPDDVVQFIESLNIYQNICLKGFMAIPPMCSEGEAERYFYRLNNIAQEVKCRKLLNQDKTEMSIGMSGDYEAAIRNGATIVRIGSAIFGKRVNQ